jgi:hypothetical protein
LVGSCGHDTLRLPVDNVLGCISSLLLIEGNVFCWVYFHGNTIPIVEKSLIVCFNCWKMAQHVSFMFSWNIKQIQNRRTSSNRDISCIAWNRLSYIDGILYIKMDHREIGFGDVDWIHLARDRDRWRALVNTVMNLRVP